MQISEEYIKRNSISLSFVKHTSVGFLFLRNNIPQISWRILFTNWIPSNGHPGEYLIREITPIHNSYLLKPDSSRIYNYNFWSSLKFRELKKYNIQWDEYEDFFINWFGIIKPNQIIQGYKPIILTAWEMFVYGYDKYFSNNYANSLYLFRSLNFNLSINERYKNYLQFISTIEDKYDPFYSWKVDLDNITYYYYKCVNSDLISQYEQ